MHDCVIPEEIGYHLISSWSGTGFTQPREYN
jgi:hypothetical protein